MILQNINVTAAMVYLTLISQIVVISVLLANKWRKNKTNLLMSYPPADYPNLYVNNAEVEHKRLQLRKLFDYSIAALSLTIVAYVYVNKVDIAMVASAIKFIAIIQLMPWFLSAYWCKENNKRMAKNFPSTKRKSSFQSRRLTDFVAPLKLLLVIVCYLSILFFSVYIYVEQLWQQQSSTALMHLALTTLMMAYLAWVLFNSLYGKKKDNFISSDDRLTIIAKRCKNTTLFITLYCIFILGLYLVKTFSLSNVYIEVITSIFIQVLLLLGSDNNSGKDYQVYR